MSSIDGKQDKWGTIYLHLTPFRGKLPHLIPTLMT